MDVNDTVSEKDQEKNISNIAQIGKSPINKGKITKASSAKNPTENASGKDDSPKLKRGETFKFISGYINSMHDILSRIKFPKKYVIIQDGFHAKKVYIDQGGVLSPLNDLEPLISDILKFSDKEFGDVSSFKYDYRDASDCAKYWLSITDGAPEKPALVRWADDPGLCFNRLPWIKDEVIDQPTPLWDELVGRIEINQQAFCDYFASVFFDDSYRQQYLWLDGPGGEGKGAFFHVLSKIYGRYFHTATPPGYGQEMDRYLWHMSHARVLAFDDLRGKDLKMVTQGWFKSLTGGMPQSIKPNFKIAQTIDMNCKVFVSANGSPDILSEPSDLRRLLYTRYSRRSNPTYRASYYDELWMESGAFLAKCIRDYELRNPRHDFIQAQKDSFDDVLLSSEMEYNDLFERNFNLEKDGFTSQELFTRFTRENFRTKQERDSFTYWLKTKFSLKLTNCKLRDKEKAYYGKSQKKGIRGLRLFSAPLIPK